MSGFTSIGKQLYQLNLEISPIILINGIAGDISMPIINILQPGAFPNGLFGPGIAQNLDTFNCHFKPLPGCSLAANQIGSYPFANQSVAANAIITSPLQVSLLMSFPINTHAGYFNKLNIMSSLQTSLLKHSSMGGSYIVATPSFIYQNCILLSLHDISNSGDIQPQTTWQWDFVQPLLTLEQAQQSYNTQMNKIANGLPTDGALYGPSVVSGTSSSSLTPSAQNLVGSTSTQTPNLQLTSI